MKTYVFVVMQVNRVTKYSCISAIFSNIDAAEKYRFDVFDGDEEYSSFIDIKELR